MIEIGSLDFKYAPNTGSKHVLMVVQRHACIFYCAYNYVKITSYLYYITAPQLYYIGHPT